jgi:hypothetical protein
MQMDGDLADLQNAFGGVGRRGRSAPSVAASVASADEASGSNRTWGSRCSMLAKVKLILLCSLVLLQSYQRPAALCTPRALCVCPFICSQSHQAPLSELPR